MKIAELLKVATLGICTVLIVLPATYSYAQPEDDEEEEPMQTRPNPMEHRMQSPASRSAPAMNQNPQSMRPGMSAPTQMKPGMKAPQVQDDGEHGDMMNPQQMGH